MVWAFSLTTKDFITYSLFANYLILLVFRVLENLVRT